MIKIGVSLDFYTNEELESWNEKDFINALASEYELTHDNTIVCQENIIACEYDTDNEADAMLVEALRNDEAMIFCSTHFATKNALYDKIRDILMYGE